MVYISREETSVPARGGVAGICQNHLYQLQSEAKVGNVSIAIDLRF